MLRHSGSDQIVVSEPIAVDVIAYNILTTVATGHEVVTSVRVLEA